MEQTLIFKIGFHFSFTERVKILFGKIPVVEIEKKVDCNAILSENKIKPIIKPITNLSIVVISIDNAKYI